MFREIRGVQSRVATGRRRWFQDPYFDLFITENAAGTPQWFQLCYRRDTPWERVLEWRRNRGFLHMKVTQPTAAGDRDAGVLSLDGLLPYEEVATRFGETMGLPDGMAGFVAEKLRQYARPARRFRRKGAQTPAWLSRLRSKL